MQNEVWGMKYEVRGMMNLKFWIFEFWIFEFWIFEFWIFEFWIFEFWILNAECGILSRRAKLVYLLDARLRDFLTMTIDNDYDRFHGDAEVSALG